MNAMEPVLRPHTRPVCCLGALSSAASHLDNIDGMAEMTGPYRPGLSYSSKMGTATSFMFWGTCRQRRKGGGRGEIGRRFQREEP